MGFLKKWKHFTIANFVVRTALAAFNAGELPVEGARTNFSRVHRALGNSSSGALTPREQSEKFALAKPRATCVALAAFEQAAIGRVFARAMLPPVGAYHTETAAMYYTNNF